MARFVRAFGTLNRIRIFKQVTTPTVLQGLAVGDLWIDMSTPDPCTRQCTSIVGSTTWQLFMSSSNSLVSSVNGKTGTVTLSTTDIPEGTSLYFTEERSQDATANMMSSEFVYDDSLNSLAINTISAGKITGLAASATTNTVNASNISSGTLPPGRLTGSYTGITGVGTIVAGTWNGGQIANAYLANSSVTINGSTVSLGGSITVSATPSGSAGGDLTGTYPNPTLTTTGVSADTYNNVTVDTKGRISAGTKYSQSSAVRTIQTVASQANGWQISSTRSAMVKYSCTINTSASLAGGAQGTVVLEIAATNSATAGDWVEVGRITNGQTVALAIALTITQNIASQVSAFVPAGYYVRLRSINTTGTPAFTYNSGQEILI